MRRSYETPLQRFLRRFLALSTYNLLNHLWHNGHRKNIQAVDTVLAHGRGGNVAREGDDDHREFARLVERWETPIRNLCARMTGDLHRGEDLKQETFSRVFEKRKDYEAEGRFSTWLWRIALNVCYDELRRQDRRREFLSSSGEEDHGGSLEERAAEAPTPDIRAAQLEEGELVRQALQQLPDIYRSVVVLRHYEDLKLAKIAESWASRRAR